MPSPDDGIHIYDTFDLEAALAGEPLVTASGILITGFHAREVVSRDHPNSLERCDFPYAAFSPDGYITYTKRGTFYLGQCSGMDLRLLRPSTSVYRRIRL